MIDGPPQSGDAMNVTRVAIDDPQWSEFASSHPMAGPFHLPVWTTCLADCHHLKSFALVVKDGASGIIGGVPVIEARRPFGALRWVSLPFSDWCPPLVREGVSAEKVLGALSAHTLSEGISELEIRAELPAMADAYPLQVGYHHIVDLPSDPGDLHPKKNHRNFRNRAIRNGVTIETGNSPQEVATFFHLHTLTRRRHGVPVQPRRLFDLIGERMLAKDLGFVATAMLADEPVAAAIYLAHNGTLVAKYHASDPDQLDSGAGFLLDWEIMVAACDRGYNTLDMGRSDLDADGLRLYKSSWGATERPLVYTHVSQQAPKTEGVSVGELPKRIIRNSPLWVCRALGEALYRWSA